MPQCPLHHSDAPPLGAASLAQFWTLYRALQAVNVIAMTEQEKKPLEKIAAICERALAKCRPPEEAK